MNEEVLKIRENNNLDLEIAGSPKRINQETLIQMKYELNINMTRLFFLRDSNDVKVDDYIEEFIKNIYIVLDMFSRMDVYPNYFYSIIFKINSKYQEMAKVYNRDELKNEIDYSPEIPRMIRDGIKNGHCSYRSSLKCDINDAFLEMVSFYQAYNMPYNNKTIEQCKKSFKKHYINIINIMDNSCTSVLDFEDIEYMSKLLFEFLSFFVEIGVNPKEYLDEYIDSKKETITK